MSSNFWSSSHSLYHLQTRENLQSSRSTDLQYATPRQLYCLWIWFANLIQKLGKRLMLRQIPLSTATVFFRRFYLKNSICETNPFLVLTACVFVAAKVEETPVHIKVVVSEAKAIFIENNIRSFPAETNKVGEMEFYLLEDLDFHLVVFHPYRAMFHICGREPADGGRFAQTRQEEDKPDEEAERLTQLLSRGSGEGLMEIEEGVLQMSLFIINDTYRTDVHLLYPPYIIALACLYLGFCLTSMSSSSNPRTRNSTSQLQTLKGSIDINEALGLPPPPASAAEFIASFQVSLPILLACVQDIVSLYPIWDAFEPAPLKGAAPRPEVKRDKFGPEDAEALVRKMIEERTVDVGHPDHAGQIIGKKRKA